MANGITLKVDSGPYIVTSGPSNFKSDAGLTTAVTYPVTITSDTVWYCSAAVAAAVPDATFTVTQLDGTTLLSSATIRVGQTDDTFLRPTPSTSMTAADLTVSSRLLSTGETNIERYVIQPTQQLLTGYMYTSYFTALKSETTTNVAAITGATAAAATPTLVRFGLYTVDSPGNLTLVASTANDTTLFASTYTKYTKAFSTPYARVAGRRYALSVLCVSAGACPILLGSSVALLTIAGGVLQTAPPIAQALGSQTDLPATVTYNNVNWAAAAVLPYFEMT